MRYYGIPTILIDQMVPRTDELITEMIKVCFSFGS